MLASQSSSGHARSVASNSLMTMSYIQMSPSMNALLTCSFDQRRCDDRKWHVEDVVHIAVGNRLVGGRGVADAVKPEHAAPVAHAAPADEIPAALGREQTVRLDEALCQC